ncbi:hypothetical protein [Micromonospora haikouensis]|uniref:Mom family adenine methylcarbamoylation protein n=1 Tax=Micromonospora haikouensis TaxID=686309 RepID=UPI003D759301
MRRGYSQRWKHRRASWRHRHDGGFDADRYGAAAIEETPAQKFVLTHHYSGAWCNAKYRYGLYDLGPAEPKLVGVAVLGLPVGKRVLTKPLPDLVPYEESLELSRLVLLDEVPSNGESWFCAQAFKLARQVGVRGLVSFSDPVPRYRLLPDGRQEMVSPGHVGCVYQALGAAYTGLGAKRILRVLPDGSVVNERSKTKVRHREQGYRGVVARLVRHGATTPDDGEQDMAGWLRAALDEAGAARVRQTGCHRYVFRLGTRAERSRVRIALASKPYPKRHNPVGRP